MDRRKTIASSANAAPRKELTPPSTFLKTSISGKRSVSSTVDRSSNSRLIPTPSTKKSTLSAEPNGNGPEKNSAPQKKSGSLMRSQSVSTGISDNASGSLKPSPNIVRGSMIGRGGSRTTRSVSYAAQSISSSSTTSSSTHSSSLSSLSSSFLPQPVSGIQKSKGNGMSGRKSLGPGVTIRNRIASAQLSPTRKPVITAKNSSLEKPKCQSPINPESSNEYSQENNNNEKERLQRIILKLQDKLHVTITDIEKLQKQVGILEQENVQLKESSESGEETLEMLTIEKEYLDEQNQDLKSKLGSLNQEYSQLEQQFKLLQDQFKKYNDKEFAERTGTNETENGQVDTELNVFEENRRLELALVKLKEVSDDTEYELITKIENLEIQVQANSKYKQKYEQVLEELNEAKRLVEELQNQIESLADSSKLIETLTEKNFALTEENTKLRETVEELEDIRDLANDLEEAHNETEKELKNDIASLQKTVETDKVEIDSLEKRIKYFEEILVNQKQRHLEELNNSRSEVTNLLQSSAHLQPVDENIEFLQSKINELNLKINKLESTNVKSQFDLKISKIDASSETELRKIFEQSLEEYVSASVSNNTDYSVNNEKLVNCRYLIKSINVLLPIIALLDLIFDSLVKEEKAFNELFNASESETSLFFNCDNAFAAKYFKFLRSAYSMYLLKLKYYHEILDQTIDFKAVFNALSESYGILKKTASNVALMEVDESLYDVLKQAMSLAVTIFPSADGDSAESASPNGFSSVHNKTEKYQILDLTLDKCIFQKHIFQWKDFSFKNLHICYNELASYAAYTKVSLKYLWMIKGFTDSDVSLMLASNSSANGSVPSSTKETPAHISELLKNYTILQTVLDKHLQDLQVLIEEKKDTTGLIIDANTFFKQAGYLKSAQVILFDISSKIEYESYSFVAELEAKDYSTIFKALRENDDKDILKTCNLQVLEIIEQLSNVQISKIETTKKLVEEASYQKFIKDILTNFSLQSIANEEVESLKNDLYKMSESLNEKDSLIAQSSLKINILKEKLKDQAEKEQKIGQLENELAKLSADNKKQKKMFGELVKVNEQQNVELRRRLKNKNLIGDFNSVFEEKEFCSRLTLMSELQSMRDLVNYYTVHVSAQKRLNKDDKIESIFGVPLSYKWINVEPSAAPETVNMDVHRKVGSLVRDRLFTIAEKTSLVSITAPKDNKELFQWKPQQAMLNYYVATMDREIHRYKCEKKTFMKLLKH